MLQEVDPCVPGEADSHNHRVTPSSVRLNVILTTEVDMMDIFSSLFAAYVDVVDAISSRKPLPIEHPVQGFSFSFEVTPNVLAVFRSSISSS